MPSRKVNIAIGFSVAAVVVAAVVVIIVLYAFPKPVPEAAPETAPEAAPEAALPTTITYNVTSRLNQYTSTYTHDRIDIASDIEGSVEMVEDDESVIAMYRRATTSYSYTVITKLTEGYRLYFLNSGLSTVYEPIDVDSVNDLSGITTMTSTSGTVSDVTISLQY
jgi:hypothetical protein